MRFDFNGKQYEAVVCSPEHEQTTRKALRYIQRFLPGYLIGMAVTIGLLLISSFVSVPHLFVLAGFFFLGLTMIVCPFATPQTVEMFGLRRSLLFVRISGALFVAVVLGLSAALLLK
jgi:hypothetical protein